MGNQGGMSNLWPKNFCARFPSYLEYSALAGSVQGGLLPGCVHVSFLSCYYMVLSRTCTTADVDSP